MPGAGGRRGTAKVVAAETAVPRSTRRWEALPGGVRGSNIAPATDIAGIR